MFDLAMSLPFSSVFLEGENLTGKSLLWLSRDYPGPFRVMEFFHPLLRTEMLLPSIISNQNIQIIIIIKFPFLSSHKTSKINHTSNMEFSICPRNRCSFTFIIFYNILENHLQTRQTNLAMKLVSSIFKQDPLHKTLKQAGLFTNHLTQPVIAATLDLFQQKTNDNQEEQFLKIIIKQLQEKTSYSRKLKIMASIIQIAKISKYDICDIVLNKKIKTFSKPSKHKHNEIEPKSDKIEEFILEELLIPEYNYLMKIATNQELYHTCKQGDIPFDDIFRRGTKIRFIWIFKLYNIINSLIPILKSLIKVRQFNPTLMFFSENITFLANDMTIMNNFVVKALEQASMDNFMLMPYFDMLQFYQSLKEQIAVGKNVQDVYELALCFSKGLLKPQSLSLQSDQIEEIELQALRVKLISNSLKNPKKDHKRLETEYNQKIENKARKTITTEPNCFENEKIEFQDKWKQLD